MKPSLAKCCVFFGAGKTGQSKRFNPLSKNQLLTNFLPFHGAFALKAGIKTAVIPKASRNLDMDDMDVWKKRFHEVPVILFSLLHLINLMYLIMAPIHPILISLVGWISVVALTFAPPMICEAYFVCSCCVNIAFICIQICAYLLT